MTIRRHSAIFRIQEVSRIVIIRCINKSILARVPDFDLQEVSAHLNEVGYTSHLSLLASDECRSLSALYGYSMLFVRSF